MKQTDFHPGELVMVQVAVHTLLLKTTKGDGHTFTRQANTHKERPYHKTISFVFAASFFEVWLTQSRAIPQQCLQPRWLTLALTNHLWWWSCETLDEKPSSLNFLLLSNDSQQIQSVRTGRGSQRQTKQFAGGNASTAADRMWGIQRALLSTHFPNSFQKPLQAYAVLHEAIPQQYRNQQHLAFCPKL